MFDFESILNNIFNSYSLVPVAKPVVAKASYLPEIHISPKLLLDLDKSYLDFLTKLYLSSENQLNEDSRYWFIYEIAYYLRYCYPDLQMREYELILQQIIETAKKESTK